MDCYLCTVLLPRKFNPALICLSYAEGFQEAPEEAYNLNLDCKVVNLTNLTIYNLK